MNKIYDKFILIALTLFTPAFSFAATPTTFKGLVEVFVNLINKLIPLVVALALLVFFYGILKFIFSLSSNDKTDGKKAMFWGIIGLFVMVSVWGLVNVVSKSFFDIGTGNTDVKEVRGTDIIQQPTGVINTLPPLQPRSIGTQFGDFISNINIFSGSNLSKNNRDAVTESGNNSLWSLWYNGEGQLDDIGVRQYNSGDYYTAGDAASDLNNFMNQNK